MGLQGNPQRMVSRAMMKSGDARTRALGRQLSRGRVAPGSQLDLAIKISAMVMKQVGGGGGGGNGGGGGSGGAGPATGSPMTASQVYTPTASSGRRRVSRMRKANYDLAQE